MEKHLTDMQNQMKRSAESSIRLGSATSMGPHHTHDGCRGNHSTLLSQRNQEVHLQWNPGPPSLQLSGTNSQGLKMGTPLGSQIDHGSAVRNPNSWRRVLTPQIDAPIFQSFSCARVRDDFEATQPKALLHINCPGDTATGTTGTRRQDISHWKGRNAGRLPLPSLLSTIECVYDLDISG